MGCECNGKFALDFLDQEKENQQKVGKASSNNVNKRIITETKRERAISPNLSVRQFEYEKNDKNVQNDLLNKGLNLTNHNRKCDISQETNFHSYLTVAAPNEKQKSNGLNHVNPRPVGLKYQNLCKNKAVTKFIMNTINTLNNQMNDVTEPKENPSLNYAANSKNDCSNIAIPDFSNETNDLKESKIAKDLSQINELKQDYNDKSLNNGNSFMNSNYDVQNISKAYHNSTSLGNFDVQSSNLSVIVPSTNFNEEMTQKINMVRTNPKGFVRSVERAKRHIITTQSGKKFYHNKIKVALNKGEQTFDETMEYLRNLEPMEPLVFSESIVIPAPQNGEEENKDAKAIFMELNEKFNCEIYFKDFIMYPCIAILLMVVDDTNSKHAGKKRNAILNPEFKFIGISSCSFNNKFLAYYTFAK